MYTNTTNFNFLRSYIFRFDLKILSDTVHMSAPIDYRKFVWHTWELELTRVYDFVWVTYILLSPYLYWTKSYHQCQVSTVLSVSPYLWLVKIIRVYFCNRIYTNIHTFLVHITLWFKDGMSYTCFNWNS